MSDLPASLSLRHRMLRPLAGCGLVLTCAVPAGAQAVLPPDPIPVDAAKPFSAWSHSVHSMRDSLVAVARAQVGTRYLRGGTNPSNGFDCSGLVRYVMGALHVALPRTAAQQARSGSAVSVDPATLRPGDLLTFGRGKLGVSHIGIYVGGGRYVHASSGAGRVIESDIDRPQSSLIRAWRGVRRVVAGGEPEPARRGDS